MKRVLIILLALIAFSCSTTRVLSEGQSRLASNEIHIQPKGELNPSELTPYLRQQANTSLLFGWNPLVSIFNWSRKPESVWQRVGTAPVVFSPELVPSTVDNMLTRLEYLGYYNASIETKTQQRDKITKVSYIVNTGERIQIDSIVYDIPEGEFEQDFALDISNHNITKGSFLSEASLEAETLRGAAYFRNKGYYDFNKNNYFFEADTLNGKSILHYRVKSYTRNETEEQSEPLVKYRVRNVSLHHPADISFRPSLLKKLNTISPGDLYNEDIVNVAYYRLSSLNLFNSVIIEVSPVDSALLDYDIKLNGSDVLGFKLNAELSTNSSGLLGASPQLSFYHKNLFHGAERLNVSLSGNWQFIPGRKVSSSEFAASASLSLPSIKSLSGDKNNRYIARNDIKASFNYQDRPEYVRSIASISYGHSGQIAQNFFYQIQPAQLSLVNQLSVSKDFAQTLRNNPYLWDSFMNQIDLGAGAMLYHTTNASIVPKGPYRFSRLSLDLSGNLLSIFDDYMCTDAESGRKKILGLPYNQYVRAELSAGRVFCFGQNDRNAVAMRMVVGAAKAYGNSSALPFEKQFYAGGASSMRGWQVRTLGPGFSPRDPHFIIPSQTGDLKFEADIELRYPLFWKLEGAIFAEVGNIWLFKDIKKDFLEGLAADWGLGLRVNLDFILLRLDAGFRIYDPAREPENRWLLTAEQWFQRNGAAIHFGVGYPF